MGGLLALRGGAAVSDYPDFNPNWSEAVRIEWLRNFPGKTPREQGLEECMAMYVKFWQAALGERDLLARAARECIESNDHVADDYARADLSRLEDALRAIYG